MMMTKMMIMKLMMIMMMIMMLIVWFKFNTYTGMNPLLKCVYIPIGGMSHKAPATSLCVAYIRVDSGKRPRLSPRVP